MTEEETRQHPTFAQLVDWAFKGMLGLLAAGAITWCGWVTVSIVDRPVRSEVAEMITTDAPYLLDKNLILATLNDSKIANTKLTEAINNNTIAVIELKTIVKDLKN